MDTYAILRDSTNRSPGRPRTGGPFDAGTPGLEALIEPEPRIEVATLDKEDVEDLTRDDDIVAIARVMPTKLIEPFDDAAAAAAGDAWGIAAVRAETSPRSGQGTVVAVLDTGIDAAHPAFAGVDLVQQDFSGDGDGDDQGHGTHCAGTILGRDVDGARIGVATGVGQALIGKVLDNQGSGTSDMIFRGIRWAVEQGADVISMSLGFDFPGLVTELVEQENWPVALATSAALEAYRANLRMFDAIMAQVQAAEAFGTAVVVVAAAGNESERQLDKDFEVAASLPAAAEGVVSVGALQQDAAGLSIADFSNTFPQVSAPGVGIKSARAGGGTRSLSGTSMACPHVAGVAALWWEDARARSLPERSSTITSNLFANARTSVLAPGVDVADRGVGIVTAPQ